MSGRGIKAAELAAAAAKARAPYAARIVRFVEEIADLRAVATVAAAKIRGFDERCMAAQYTDTGEAWEVLRAALDALDRIRGGSRG